MSRSSSLKANEKSDANTRSFAKKSIGIYPLLPQLRIRYLRLAKSRKSFLEQSEKLCSPIRYQARINHLYDRAMSCKISRVVQLCGMRAN